MSPLIRSLLRLVLDLVPLEVIVLPLEAGPNLHHLARPLPQFLVALPEHDGDHNLLACKHILYGFNELVSISEVHTIEPRLGAGAVERVKFLLVLRWRLV